MPDSHETGPQPLPLSPANAHTDAHTDGRPVSSTERDALLALEPAGPSLPGGLTPAQAILRRMVVDAAVSPSTRRHYGFALDQLFALAGTRPLTAALLTEYRASLNSLAPSTVNVRMAAVRALVREARRNGLLSGEAAAALAGVPNIPVRGVRMGNWLTREQTRELLAVPDRATLLGKRDYAILSILVGCALRREELATLPCQTVVLRDGRWVLADLLGKRRKLRTVAVPPWVKAAIDGWTAAAGVRDGLLMRSVSKGGGRVGKSLSGRAVWTVVETAARAIAIPRLAPHDLRRTCAKLCRKAGGELEQIQMMLGHDSVLTTQRYTRIEQELGTAVNDNLGL